MGSSPGFGSTPCDSRTALFRLAFATAPPVTGLTSPHKVTRRLILQEARRQAWVAEAHHRPSTACRHAVSGSFNSPHRGAFHLSLTVLVHYRSPRVFSLGRWTSLLPTGLACPAVLKVSVRRSDTFAYEGLTPSARAFQPVRLAIDFVTPSSRCVRPRRACQPPPCNACRLSHKMGLGSSPFARHYSGNRSLFLGVLRCFSSPRALQLAYVFNQW